MKRHVKLQSTEQQHPQAAEQQAQSPSALEFATPEELLRHDASQTTVPPAVEQRLKKSVGDLPAPPRSWWRRFFGGTGA